MSDIIEITLWVGALLAVFIALPVILAWLLTLRLPQTRQLANDQPLPDPCSWRDWV